MVLISVMYPAGATFDQDYYLKTHIPLVKERWTSQGLERSEIVRAAATPDGSPPSFSIMALLSFSSAADFQTRGRDARHRDLRRHSQIHERLADRADQRRRRLSAPDDETLPPSAGVNLARAAGTSRTRGGPNVAVVRRFEKMSNVEEAGRRAVAGLGPTLQAAAGFEGCYVIDGSDDSGLSITLFDSRENAWQARLVRRVLSGFLLAVPAVVLTRQWLFENGGPLSGGAGYRLFIAGEAVLLFGTTAVVASALWWTRRRGLSLADGARVLFGATTPSPAWNKPEVTELLSPPPGSVRQPARESPADHRRAIGELVTLLPTEAGDVGAEAVPAPVPPM